MNRRGLAIAAGAALVVLLVWYFALWSPRNSELSKQRKRTDTAASQVQTLKTQLSRLQAAQRAEPVKRAKLERLRAAIPDDPGLAQFILDSNDAANRAGINFISIAPTPPSAAAAPGGGAPVAGAAAGGRPAEVKLSMTITGGYTEVLDFINRLDGLPRIIVIDTVNVTTGAAAAGTPAPGGASPTPLAAAAGPLQLNVSLSGRMFLTQVPAAFAPAGAQGSAPAAGGGSPGGTTTTTTAGASTTTTPR